jgi:hypothetical protein
MGGMKINLAGLGFVLALETPRRFSSAYKRSCAGGRAGTDLLWLVGSRAYLNLDSGLICRFAFLRQHHLVSQPEHAARPAAARIGAEAERPFFVTGLRRRKRRELRGVHLSPELPKG